MLLNQALLIFTHSIFYEKWVYSYKKKWYKQAKLVILIVYSNVVGESISRDPSSMCHV